MVPEGMTRLRKGKKANSQLRNEKCCRWTKEQWWQEGRIWNSLDMMAKEKRWKRKEIPLHMNKMWHDIGKWNLQSHVRPKGQIKASVSWTFPHLGCSEKQSKQDKENVPSPPPPSKRWYIFIYMMHWAWTWFLKENTMFSEAPSANVPKRIPAWQGVPIMCGVPTGDGRNKAVHTPLKSPTVRQGEARWRL